MKYKFYGNENVSGIRPAARGEKYNGINNPLDLYDYLFDLWCADTCAPRMREDWTKENRTMGQCSITAFIAQDIFGGEVLALPTDSGGLHCFNVIDGVTFDLTSEQFGEKATDLDYTKGEVQDRKSAAHFFKEEKRARYEYLKGELEKKCSRSLGNDSGDESTADLNYERDDVSSRDVDKSRVRLNTIDLVLNAATFLVILASVIAFFVVGGKGNMDDWGIKCFKYFTVDSNLFNAIVCGIYVVFNILAIRGKDVKISKSFTLVRFMATTSVAYTFLVVVCFLFPVMGFGPMFGGRNFFMHFACPVFSVISFVALERGVVLTKWQKLLGLIPIFIYGTVYLVVVVFLEKGEDFYRFNTNGAWVITYPILILIGTLLSLGLARGHNKFVGK